MLWLLPIAAAGTLDWGDEEIVVVGESDVQRARAALVTKLESLGFTAMRKDGKTVFRPPSRWMGRLTIDDDGWIDWGDPLLVFNRFVIGNAPGITAQGQALPSAGATITAEFTPFPEPKKRQHVHDSVADALVEELRAYQETLEGRALTRALEVLPGRLDALWLEGVPLDGNAWLAEPRERRDTVLEHWVSRSDTISGRAAAQATGAWIRGTLQDTEHAFARWELQQAELRRGDGLRLWR